MSASPVDPKGDAVVRLATLVGASDGERVRAIVAALDPVMLPLFLELGSILFFGAAFPHAKQGKPSAKTRTASAKTGKASSYTRDEALADLLTLLASGAVTDGRLLARRWGVSETQRLDGSAPGHARASSAVRGMAEQKAGLSLAPGASIVHRSRPPQCTVDGKPSMGSTGSNLRSRLGHRLGLSSAADGQR